MLSQICLRIELLFWNLTIQTLSNSKVVRNAIKSVYAFGRQKKISSWMIIAAIGLLTGFVSGLTVYHLASLLK
ncbi:MAG: hypothetical protein AB9891_15520 [Anaerolineaceae bacterium]